MIMILATIEIKRSDVLVTTAVGNFEGVFGRCDAAGRGRSQIETSLQQL